MKGGVAGDDVGCTRATTKVSGGHLGSLDASRVVGEAKVVVGGEVEVDASCEMQAGWLPEKRGGASPQEALGVEKMQIREDPGWWRTVSWDEVIHGGRLGSKGGNVNQES